MLYYLKNKIIHYIKILRYRKIKYDLLFTDHSGKISGRFYYASNQYWLDTSSYLGIGPHHDICLYIQTDILAEYATRIIRDGHLNIFLMALLMHKARLDEPRGSGRHINHAEHVDSHAGTSTYHKNTIKVLCSKL